MRDPNNDLFRKWQELMTTGLMVGEYRPVGRVTLGKNVLREHFSERPGPWRNILFRQPQDRELFNVMSIEIQRDMDQDAATCTIVVANDDAFPWTQPEFDDTIFRPGFLTPYKEFDAPNYTSIYEDVNPSGDYPTKYNFEQPSYPVSGYGTAYMRNRMTPNRLVRTYQGYGSDNAIPGGDFFYLPNNDNYVAPWDDTQLVLTGTWLIDSVEFGTNGLISIQCRDLGKLLLEQFIYPRLIPLDRYPLVYGPVEETESTIERPFVGQDVANRASSTSGPKYSHSNFPYYGDRSVHGHNIRHAFDGRPDTYWLSVGNSERSDGFSFEYIQAATGGNQINTVDLDLIGRDYVVYISVWEDGGWQGGSVIPYDPNHPVSFPNRSNVPYVKRVTSGSNTSLTITLDRMYRADYVRVTFTNLYNFGIGPFVYRAGVREMRVRSEKIVSESFDVTNVTEPGVIQDWSEVIKELCGWSGFTWYATDVAIESDWLDPNFDDSTWKDAGIVKQQGTAAYPYEGFPEYWNDPSAYWIWSPDGMWQADTGTPPGEVYFRKVYNVASDRRVVVEVTADDEFDLYFNEERIESRRGLYQMRTTHRVGLTLPAGKHVFGARVKNIDWPNKSENFGSFLFSLYEADAQGNLIEPVNVLMNSDSSWQTLGYPRRPLQTRPDPTFGWARDGTPLILWGDIEHAGTGPKVETEPDWLINKSVMEGCNQIADMLGFVFFVDEFGGVVFRQPNIWSLGNFVTDPNSRNAPGYLRGDGNRGYNDSHPIEFHENANLMEYSVRIEDAQLRSEILVIGNQPDIHNDNKYIAGGAVLVTDDPEDAEPVVDFTSELAGQIRLMFVPPDQTKGYSTAEECQRMAEMAALFINFTYRAGNLTAPAHPGLQLDDQVRIFERSTAESYVHYVSAISTTMNMDSGVYTMDVTTHWLGRDPSDEWFLNSLNLTDAVLQFPAVKAAQKRAELSSSPDAGSEQE